MAYTKTTWVNGETPLNADNLNNIEGGIKDNETSIGNITGKILWENPNPTAEFQPQNITLNSNNYDCYEIIYLQDLSTQRLFNTGKILKGHGTILDFQAMLPHYRAVNYVSDTTLQIGEGIDVYYTSPASTVVSNTTCVPLYIVGYKTGLFGGQS
jgi:hypothetical protein